jgi:hypothetical protein
MRGERKCLICGCVEERACEGGCAWVDENVDLCTACCLKVPIAVLVKEQAREIALRRNVYRRKVRSGAMPLAEATKHLAAGYAILYQLKALEQAQVALRERSAPSILSAG